MTLATTITRNVWARNSALVNLALVGMGSLLIALLAQVRIMLPFTPVPVTGQTLGVLLIAAALGSRLGAATVALYIAEGALGLPFFAGGGLRGGVHPRSHWRIPGWLRGCRLRGRRPG